MSLVWLSSMGLLGILGLQWHPGAARDSQKSKGDSKGEVRRSQNMNAVIVMINLLQNHTECLWRDQHLAVLLL